MTVAALNAEKGVEVVGTPSADVLLSGSTVGSDRPDTRAPGRRFVLRLDRDHVEWRRGRRRDRWLRPGHHADAQAQQQLAAVVRAVIGEDSSGSRTAVLLVDVLGCVLARLAFGRTVEVDLGWPHKAFDALTTYGVEYRVVAYPDLATFYEAYPGARRGPAAWWHGRTSRKAS